MQYTSSTENYSSSMRDSPSKWAGKDEKGYSYKKASYQYSSSGKNHSTSYPSKGNDKNIDQLDALLEDLKNERQITTRERELLPSTTYRTIERDPAGTVTKTTRVIKSSKQSSLPQQVISDDVETFSTSDYSTLKSANYSGFEDSLKRNERLYSAGRSPTGGQFESKTKIYESNRTLNNAELLPTTTTSKTTNIEKELQDIALDDGILPAPGTKVTTTVRTYTYEIPAGGPGSTTSTINRSQRYNTLQQQESNLTANYAPARPTVPQTVVYNTESYSTVNRNNERPNTSNQSYEIREHKETTNTIHNNYPGVVPQARDVPIGPSGGTGPGVGPTTNRTVVYNIHKTNTNNIHTVDEPTSRYPPHSPLQHSPGSARPHSPPLQHLPPGGTTNRYFYKETSNVVNTIHGPGPNEPHGIPQKPTPIAYSIAPPATSAPGNGYPPHAGDGYPPNSSYNTYKYTGTSTINNSTTTRRGPDYGSPSPFPVPDGIEYPPANGNPPQRVDELMQSFGTTDSVDRGDIESPHRKREIETAVASPNQQHVPSVNKAGKEIYYPPGHETMITKREEMSAGSAAGGRWAKGSGMYEYESGQKSKSTSKSGGAMVPVCLPLCCAMPCSIM